MTLLETARAWLAEDPDPVTAAELSALIDRAEAGDTAAADELTDAFDGTLQFGTAGLRGRLGPGSNRMNRIVVARAAAGLAAYLVANGGTSVVVGYDARRNSDVFARDTAAIMTGAGITAMVLPSALPTPVLRRIAEEFRIFEARNLELHCAARCTSRILATSVSSPGR